MKTVIECRGECLELNSQETIMEVFGWLLHPIIRECGSYEEALKKLDWTVHTCPP